MEGKVNALEWAHAKISFEEATALVGKFDIRKYRFMEKPLLALDDIYVKRLTIFKASSAGGTVFMQIAMSYWLDQRPGSIQVAMQSDDDCAEWMKQRGKKWLKRIPSLVDALSSDKYAITNSLWLWPHQFLLFTGPSENAQQAKQVTHLISDEAHTDSFKEGALASFEERMSKRWGRMALHTTTAPDEGKEVDRFYNMGGQNEFHLRCIKCDKLIWPLWEEDSEQYYNGHKVFVFKDADTEPVLACPHCTAVYIDDSKSRFALQESGDYVTMNPSHLRENESFRWACFSAFWMSWASHLAKFRESIEAAKIGNLQPHEDWIKKRLTKAYKPHLPNLGESHGTANYLLGQPWNEPNTTRILTADYQAGKKAEGSHLWALCTEWSQDGSSRRIAWRRLDTWAQLRAMQLELGVESRNVYIDCGYDDRTVFYQCSMYKWYASQGSSLQQFHTITVDKGTKNERKITIPMPYSQPERANGNVGAKQPDKLKTELSGALPSGWCLKLVMGNEQLYPYLYALQSGATGRYFGIASDMPDTYTNGFPAFMPVVEKNKRTNLDTVIWRKVKPIDHPWDCEVMALMGACRAGCYPLKELEQDAEKEQTPELCQHSRI